MQYQRRIGAQIIREQHIEQRQESFRDGQLQLNELTKQIEQNKSTILERDRPRRLVLDALARALHRHIINSLAQRVRSANEEIRLLM